MILTVLLVLSAVVNVALLIGVRNLIKQNEMLEDYIVDLQAGLISALQRMRSIDIRGAFEAEDEVGFVFKTLDGIVQSLNAFVETE
jgi:hypothetical protein